MKDAFFIGLDLGQLSDYTALTIVRRLTRSVKEEREVRRRGHLVGFDYEEKQVLDEYWLQHLHRYPIGTPYTEIADRVKEIKGKDALQELPAYVVADTTGVGLPVFEMLEERGVEDLHGITITGGDSVSRDGKIIRVPKKDLVSNLQVIVQNGDLRWAKDIPFRDVLRKELQNFKTKINISTGHASFEAWRDGDHDDMVLSLAMACWFAENKKEPDDWSNAKGYFGYTRDRVTTR